MKNFLFHPSNFLIILHLALVVGFGVRVIMKRPATGVALAWLFLIAAVPYGGPIAYLLVGEKRVDPERRRRLGHLRESAAELVDALGREKLTSVDWSQHPPEAREMDRLGRMLVGLPTVSGSTGVMISNTEECLRGIAADIDAARDSVLMEFYIWNEGGLVDGVFDALVRAAGRGVECRVLIDGLGASPWWKKSKQPKLLREAGVRLQAALPVGILRMIFGRNDVRVHRKIVVIDGATAWSGSMNMVDPRFFKQDANVGEWVDAMMRVEGAIVTPLALTMIGDWTL